MEEIKTPVNEDMLASGDFGSVYKVGSTTAQKVSTINSIVEFRAALRELDVLHMLDGVPGVLGIKGFNVNVASGIQDFPFEFRLNMALGGGELNDEKTEPEVVVRDILRGVGVTLFEARRRGIVHRDIKGSNILRRLPEGWAPVDWGLATYVDRVGLNKRSVSGECGAPAYRAPELCMSNRGYTDKVDVWALGVVVAGLVGMRWMFDRRDVNPENIIWRGLGTPDRETWPDFDYDNIRFKERPARKIVSVLAPTLASDNSHKIVASESLVDLVNRMLALNPKHRIGIEALLQHPFVTENGAWRYSAPPLPALDPERVVTPGSRSMERPEDRTACLLQVIGPMVMTESSSIAAIDFTFSLFDRFLSKQSAPVDSLQDIAWACAIIATVTIDFRPIKRFSVDYNRLAPSIRAVIMAVNGRISPAYPFELAQYIGRRAYYKPYAQLLFAQERANFWICCRLQSFNPTLEITMRVFDRCGARWRQQSQAYLFSSDEVRQFMAFL